MEVIYHGVDSRFRPLPADETRQRLLGTFALADPYILYLGKLEQRKNIVRMLEAYGLFRRETTGELKLVLAGRPTWDRTFLDKALDRLKLREHVIETGYVQDPGAPLLYNGAEMFLFATLWEGFGLPVLEAMACRTPVITSNLSSLPEIAGDAALLVDPYSVQDIAGAMHTLYNDRGLRKNLIEKGSIQSAKFSWERTARQTIEAYKKAALM